MHRHCVSVASSHGSVVCGKCMGVLHVVKTEFADALGEAGYDRAVAL